MDFGAYKNPIEVILKRSNLRNIFYFKDIYSSVNGKWYRSSWVEFKELHGTDYYRHICNYYQVKINIYDVESGTSLKSWENKGCTDSYISLWLVSMVF